MFRYDHWWPLLEDALEKGELVDEKSIIPDTYEKIGERVYEEKQRLKVYQFGDIKIGREKYTYREAEIKTPEEPVPRLPLFSEEKTWRRYYVYKGNEFVSDDNEASRLIKKATGVKMPALESWDSSVSVVTKLDFEEDINFKARLESQPDDRNLAIEANNMRRELESSPEEFNLGNLGYDLSHNEEIIKIIYELSEKFRPG